MAVKFDTLLRQVPFGQITGEAQRYERMGFDAVWTFESSHDPFLPLMLAADATEKLEIGTNITVAFARAPFALAQTAWDLQAASGGRFHLGVGTQVRAHVERRFSMPFDRPAARITDYIRCLRAIWDSFQNGTRPSYEGEFYQYRLINPFFNPGPIDHPEIPIYLAGVNERMCRAAGEVADGFHVHPMHSIGYLEDVVKPAIAEGARIGGRDASKVSLYAPVFTVTGETEAERRASEEEVRRQIAFYGSTPSYRALFEYHGFGDEARKLSQLMREGDMDGMPLLVPDALMEELSVAGTTAELPRRLRERYEGVLDRISLYFPISVEDAEEEWGSFVTAFRQ